MNNKTPKWVVVRVQPKEDFTLTIDFADGSRRLFDATELVRTPLMQKLQNKGFFMMAQAKHGSVEWSDELDIDPEYLYDASSLISD